MGSLSWMLSCILFMSLWAGSNTECSDNTRVRKPWHSLTDAEQLLYSDGFKRLHTEGILILFFESHDDASDNYAIHTTPQNFFWHSYWLYEFENSFRQLGGDYECFAMPYWDVTHDAEYWEETENPDIADIPIYTSHLGGDGLYEDNYCLQDGGWSVEDYTTEYLCADTETTPNCCLKRYHQDVDNSELATRSLLSDTLVNDSYVLYDSFSDVINIAHMKIHTFIGSVEQHTHFNPSKGEPEVDPLFPLFHTFIDYIRLMREDCAGFDLVSADELDEYVPYAYSKNDNMTLDYVMTYSVLCDDTDGEGERLCSHTDITPRLMYDMSPNRGFGVKYELGEFWSENDELKAACADYLNSTWWSVVETDTDDDTDAIFEDDDSDTDTDSGVDTDTDTADEEEAFVRDRVLHSENGMSSATVTIGAMVLMVIAVAVMALLRGCGLALRQKKVDLTVNAEGRGYGAMC